MSHDNTNLKLASSTVWVTPAYEIIELGSEVTGYIYTDSYQPDFDSSFKPTKEDQKIRDKGA